MGATKVLVENEFYRAWGLWAVSLLRDGKQCPACLTKGSVDYRAEYSCGGNWRCNVRGCGEIWPSWATDEPMGGDTEFNGIMDQAMAVNFGREVIRKREEFLKAKGKLLPQTTRRK